MSQAILYDYAMSFIGKPYIFGGDDPIKGIDCSGLAIELLKSQGLLPRAYDSTAKDLYKHLLSTGQKNIIEGKFGALVFFGKNIEMISHVGFCLNNTLMVEAGGGDSTVTTAEIAAQRNAFVRVRPIGARSDKVAIVQIHYPWS